MDMTAAMRRFTRGCFALMFLGMAAGAAAQSAPAGEQAGTGLKLGIVPFADATASGNKAAGADVARTMLSEVVHSTALQARLLTDDETAKSAEMDPEKAIALGRTQHLDLIFVGTVLDAHSQESNKTGWIPAVRGQSGSVTVHRLKATVVLQGELYDVATGRRIFSTRVTGTDTNNAVGGTAFTKFGAWGNESYRGFLESPMGQALQKAIADLTKQVASAHR
jgi:hypothetical protein